MGLQPSKLVLATFQRTVTCPQAARAVMDLRERLRTGLGRKPKAVALLDELFVNPFITVAHAETFLGTSNQTARQAVRFLEEVGILREASGRRWGKLYLAEPILRALEEPPPA